MVHAENGDAIDVLVKKALAEGKTEPKYHALTRPPETEGEATNRAIQLARVAGCALYVVHVSCKESVEPIMLAREKGWDVWGETCTQYFFVDYTLPRAARTSRARSSSTRRRRATRRTRTCSGTRSAATRSAAISTDHCAFTLGRAEDARPGRLLEDPERRAGAREPAAHDPPLRRRARAGSALNRMVELLCTNPAKLFGLYPAQGHDRGRLRRRHRRLRPREAAHDHGREPGVEDGLQPLRGDGGRRRRRDRAAARERDRGGRRGRREARHRAVRQAGEVRRAARRDRSGGPGRGVGVAARPWREPGRAARSPCRRP